MTITTNSNIDVGLFDTFVKRSHARFNRWVELGLGFGTHKMYIQINNAIIPTDVVSYKNSKPSQFSNTLNLIYYEKSTFREVLPSIDGAIKAKPQTYGMAMLAFLGGIHTSTVQTAFYSTTNMNIQIMQTVAINGRSNGGLSILGINNTENFNYSIITGLEISGLLLCALIRYEEHSFTSSAYDIHNNPRGHTAFTINYKQNKTCYRVAPIS